MEGGVRGLPLTAGEAAENQARRDALEAKTGWRNRVCCGQYGAVHGRKKKSPINKTGLESIFRGE
jgi:hypothetical protein